MRTPNLTILEGLQIGKRELKQASAMPLKKAEKFLNKKGKLSYRSTTKERADAARKVGGDLNHPSLLRGHAHSGTVQSAIDRHGQMMGFEPDAHQYKNTPHHIETAVGKLEKVRKEKLAYNPDDLPDRFPKSLAIQKLVHPKPVFGGGKQSHRISDSEANNYIRDNDQDFISLGNNKTQLRLRRVMNKKDLPQFVNDRSKNTLPNIPNKDVNYWALSNKLANYQRDMYAKKSAQVDSIHDRIRANPNINYDKAVGRFYKTGSIPDIYANDPETSEMHYTKLNKLRNVHTFPYKNDMEHKHSTSYVSRGEGSAVELQAALRAARDPEVLARRKSRANHARTLRRLSMNSLDPVKKAKIQAQLRLMMGR